MTGGRLDDTAATITKGGAGSDGMFETHGIRVGYSSQACGKARSDDFFGVSSAEDAQSAARGVILAIADGVSSAGGGGRTAAESVVRMLLSDFYATRADWGVAHALDKVLSAINSWLFAENSRQPTAGGMATTLSLLVLRGRELYLAHVGDTRVYRLRGGNVERLTRDHVWPRWDMRHTLRRAVGLDQSLVVDYAKEAIEPGDMYLLVSDGVWEVMGERAMGEALSTASTPEALAQALVAGATSMQK